MLKVLAAGSLRRIWAPLMARFTAETGILTATDFGPAGMLRERIEQGESCDLFASANMAHPLTLQRRGIAQEVHPFAGNRLCLTVARSKFDEDADWLETLCREELRLATSTPDSVHLETIHGSCSIPLSSIIPVWAKASKSVRNLWSADRRPCKFPRVSLPLHG